MGKAKYGKDIIAVAQIMRSQGQTVKQIQERLKVGERWVKENTANTERSLPFNPVNSIEMVGILIDKTLLKAIKDNCENPKEYAWPLGQYASVLKTLTEISDAVTDRAEAEAAQRDILLLKKDGKEHTAAIEVLQAHYDNLVEEL